MNYLIEASCQKQPQHWFLWIIHNKHNFDAVGTNVQNWLLDFLLKLDKTHIE